ncbi:MAG TPA: hypothetical protein VF517_11525 [Thermoleophilaceae bacterium]|jgi:hypothetical protein
MANQVTRREDAELRFREIAAQAGLPEPDEVVYHEDDEELEFLWHEQKLAVVVELDENSGGAVDSAGPRSSQ